MDPRTTRPAPLTPELRSQRSRRAALIRWANEDPRPNVERGQRGLRAKFERETRERFPGLDETEILRRADCAYRAHMAGLAFASAKARARKASSSTEDVRT